MEYTIAFFQYALVLSIILTTVYTAFFYKEVYSQGAIIPRFIQLFFFSGFLFIFLNKALKWNPEKVYAMTVKFFLALSFISLLAHTVIILINRDYSGMKLVSFVVLITLFITCLGVFTGSLK